MVRLELEDERVDVDYETLDNCLSDNGLKALLDDGLVAGCTIYCGDKRIAGLSIMTWDKLREQVVSNSTTILRSR